MGLIFHVLLISGPTHQLIFYCFFRIDDIQDSLVTKAGEPLLCPNNLLIPFMFRE